MRSVLVAQVQKLTRARRTVLKRTRARIHRESHHLCSQLFPDRIFLENPVFPEDCTPSVCLENKKPMSRSPTNVTVTVTVTQARSTMNFGLDFFSDGPKSPLDRQRCPGGTITLTRYWTSGEGAAADKNISQLFGPVLLFWFSGASGQIQVSWSNYVRVCDDQIRASQGLSTAVLHTGWKLPPHPQS